jgi:hypothetical protein
MPITTQIQHYGLAKHVIENGGSLHPLIVPSNLTNGTGLFNPSIYKDGDTLIVNVRHCQYTILHAEKGRFEHQWGPLVYLCPEDDLTLTTTNYLCTLDDNLDVATVQKVDTSTLDVPPIWEFVGLEDARLVRWSDKLYMVGVRRDTTPNGVGRMELSEIKVTPEYVKEVSRWRIPAPPPDTSYCEKNWVPILDMPYHFVKWSNPTEVVKVDPHARTCKTVFHGEYAPKPYDYRGGTQVIPYKDYRITLSHVVTSFHKSEAGRKDAQYRQAFIVWDKDWNVVKYSEPFPFMNAEIEFCCGMTKHNDDYLITFGFQDNAAYLLRIPEKVFEDLIDV